MDKQKLQVFLKEKLSELRKLPYKDICVFIDNPQTDARGEGETFCQMEWESFYDDSKSRNIRVMVCIGDKGWRAFKPLCDGFIITPDGKFL